VTHRSPAASVQQQSAADEPGPTAADGKRTFSDLAAAIAAAADGAVVTVDGDGPFVLEPLVLRGKALTLRAAPGAHPCLVLAAGAPDQAARPLFTTDRPLALEGLELRCPADEPGARPGPAHLVCCEQAPLRLVNCRLFAPKGSALVVCRNPGQVEVRDCHLTADALAVCVEVGDGRPCTLHLSGSEFRIHESGGAAVSVWAPEVRQPSAVRLRLERNAVDAGRVLAFAALPAGVEVEASGNQFTFRQALVSYVGFPGPDGWRRATVWRGRENVFHGGGDWVSVEGEPAGVHSLEDWRRLWQAPASE
jgi:hypothetical protein